MEEIFPEKRLVEMADRSSRTGLDFFTPFLTPPEAGNACRCARKAGVNCFLCGGYDGAERVMACFSCEEEPPSFPISAIRMTWPHQAAPRHQDLLGASMALGMKRSCFGDLVLQQEEAVMFAEKRAAEVVSSSLTEAGHVRLQCEILSFLPEVEAPEGTEVKDTVSSPRLDAVLSSGFRLSRTQAAEVIASGGVKLRFVPTLKGDARVQEGDVISARGYGRLRVEEIASPTKKGRLPVRLIRFGEKHNHR